MTKKRELIRRIAKAAKAQGITFEKSPRKGSRHDIWLLDGMTVPIPRHNEIPNDTARGIWQECEPKLGKEWWK